MRRSIETTLMDMAWLMASHGTCARMQVGTVITREKRIISTGYNGAPAGMAHCEHPPNDKNPCTVAVHAEANAIAFAARYGVSTNETTLYTTMCPCRACAQLIVNAGIERVIAATSYHDMKGAALLQEAGVTFELHEESHES